VLRTANQPSKSSSGWEITLPVQRYRGLRKGEIVADRLSGLGDVVGAVTPEPTFSDVILTSNDG
jgi:hypothetical protein